MRLHRSVMALSVLLAYGSIVPASVPNPLEEWRERLARWCEAATRYVMACGGTSHDALPFSTVAYNARREGSWTEARLLEVAAFVHREMETFQAFVDAGVQRPAQQARREWPSARGEHDDGDGVR